MDFSLQRRPVLRNCPSAFRRMAAWRVVAGRMFNARAEVIGFRR